MWLVKMRHDAGLFVLTDLTPRLQIRSLEHFSEMAPVLLFYCSDCSSHLDSALAQLRFFFFFLRIDFSLASKSVVLSTLCYCFEMKNPPRHPICTQIKLSE